MRYGFFGSLPPPPCAHSSDASGVVCITAPCAAASYQSVRDRRLEPHPDALLPYGKKTCTRYNKTGKRCARGGWAMLPPPLDPCPIRDTCSWRSIYAAATASDTSTVPLRGVLLDWQRWAVERNATEVFEHFLRRLVRRETNAPMLPCLCPTASRFVFMRVALDQLIAPPPPLIAAPAAPQAGDGAPGCCSADSPCTLVSSATGWCSGAASKQECHRSRTEGRPCAWSGGRCTKGFLHPGDGEPSCPVAVSGGAPPTPRGRTSHFDLRDAASADFVDVQRALRAVNAKVPAALSDLSGSSACLALPSPLLALPSPL